VFEQLSRCKALSSSCVNNEHLSVTSIQNFDLFSNKDGVLGVENLIATFVGVPCCMVS
jgi:hypothetical protein